MNQELENLKEQNQNLVGQITQLQEKIISLENELEKYKNDKSEQQYRDLGIAIDGVLLFIGQPPIASLVVSIIYNPAFQSFKTQFSQFLEVKFKDKVERFKSLFKKQDKAPLPKMKDIDLMPDSSEKADLLLANQKDKLALGIKSMVDANRALKIYLDTKNLKGGMDAEDLILLNGQFPDKKVVDFNFDDAIKRRKEDSNYLGCYNLLYGYTKINMLELNDYQNGYEIDIETLKMYFEDALDYYCNSLDDKSPTLINEKDMNLRYYLKIVIMSL